MAAIKDHTALLKRLKQQVKALQKKEEKTRHQLRLALKKIRVLSQSYKAKLAGKVRDMHGKIAETQLATYGKVAADIERQLINAIRVKSEALSTAVERIEKEFVAKLKKRASKKPKAATPRKKSAKTKSMVSKKKKAKSKK